MSRERLRRPVALDEVVLTGRAVRLEPLRATHAEELWPAASEHDVWTYMIHDVRNPADLRTWIGQRLEAQRAGAALAFVQRDARTGAAFGSTSLFDHEPAHRRIEIGHTWVGASHRRTAANTEAKLLLLTHAFEDLRMSRVQFKCDARNERSRRAIQRLGATFEGVLRAWMILPDGRPRDTCMFSLLAHEWPGAKERLLRRLAAGERERP
jgi:RimJ/RimL family protein N-acetyltransferase